MPGVRIIAHTLGVYPDNAIENPYLMVAVGRLPKPALELQVEVRGQLLLVLDEAVPRPKGRDTVAMDDEGNGTIGMV